MAHFDVQLIGGMVLHGGKIAEMKTGEGKTLVATLPLYLNALEGRGAHLVTHNDYLARRDRDWMGPIYEFLGLTVGCIQHDSRTRPSARRPTAATSPMAPTTSSASTTCATTWRTTPRTSCCATCTTPSWTRRTACWWTRPAPRSSSPARDQADRDVRAGGPGDAAASGADTDYIVDEKAKTATLTEDGVRKVEQMLGMTQHHRPRERGAVPARERGAARPRLLQARTWTTWCARARSSSWTSSPAG